MKNENANDKKEYISRTLSRTHNKKYENYVITRIWHKLDRLDVKFVTQQYVARPGGFALVDLYLPQVKMFIEIDEGQHQNKINKNKDEIRERDIISNTENQPFERIDVTKSVEKINEQCDNLILKIREHIEALSSSFRPWDNTEEDPQTYIKKGKISLTDNVAFRTCKDAANCFGHNYINFQRGGTNHPLKSDTLIWFPKLYRYGEWINQILDDGTEITEKNIDKKKNSEHIKEVLNGKKNVRICFAYGKDALGITRYRFKGVFKLDRVASKAKECTVWKKVSDEVDTVKPSK